ncbi:MAG: NAD-dependent malic enzyme, partial [Labilithrix sp.]|nr:NAD-dependent malic enzyme [Labilithrix sp.]
MNPATPTVPTFGVVSDESGECAIDVRVAGDALLRCPLTNKGTAFSTTERAELGLVGLLPPRIESLEEQVARAYASFLRETTSLARYRFLRRIQDRNEVLFYALLQGHIREMMPVVYTPTVGEGVERFSDVYEEPRGLCFSIDDPRSPSEIVTSHPLDDVR